MNRLKILVVDDHRASSETLALALGDAGFETSTAANTVDTLAIAQAKPIDVLIIDHDLRDGYGENIRNEFSKFNDQLRTILVTGHNIDPNRFEQQFDHILYKPLNIEQLEEILFGWRREAVPQVEEI